MARMLHDKQGNNASVSSKQRATQAVHIICGVEEGPAAAACTTQGNWARAAGGALAGLDLLLLGLHQGPIAPTDKPQP